ncbi:MAG: hypothetical protein H6567_02330 [Lewinellaceae bacterium]|nr:hypothetical protein [Lewinellaceae bacterium]
MNQWVERGERHALKITKNTLLVGLVIFICSYGGLYLAVRMFPNFFVKYLDPIFNSAGERDIFFYLHPFILAFALAIFWNRFRKYFHGNKIKIGLEFGAIYAFVALVPLLWITWSAMDIPLSMAVTWLVYGLFQATLAGIMLSYLDPSNVVSPQG